jgi:cytochrome c oxidase subunit 2
MSTPERAAAPLRVPYVRLVLVALAIWLALSIVMVLFTRAYAPEQAAKQAERFDTLHEGTIVAACAMFAFVVTMMAYALISGRQPRPDQRYQAFAERVGGAPGQMVRREDGPPVYGNATIEIVWTAIPLVIVLTLAIISWVLLNKNEGIAGVSDPISAAQAADPQQKVYGDLPGGGVRVVAEGQQFWWKYTYMDIKGPDGKPLVTGTLYLPNERQSEIVGRADDVIHSFWVPAFRLKSDVVPGIDTGIDVDPDKVGTFPVVCAELCGVGHAMMRSAVKVLPPDEFDRWAAEQSRPHAPPQETPTP